MKSKGILDYFIASQHLKAQQDVPVDLSKGVPEEPFPSAPSKIRQEKLPKGFGGDVGKDKKLEELPQLEKLSPDAAILGRLIADEAENLRAFEKEVEVFKKEQKAALLELQEKAKYDERLKSLEKDFLDWANTVVGISAKLGETSHLLMRMDGLLVSLSREMDEQKIAPNEYKMLLQAVESSVGKDKAAEIVAAKEKLVAENTQLIYKIKRMLVISGEKDKHRQSILTSSRVRTLYSQVTDDLNQEIREVTNNLHSFLSKLTEIDYDLENVIQQATKNKIVPISKEPMQMAANKKNQNDGKEG